MLYPIIKKYTDKKEKPFFLRFGELQQVNKFMGIVIYQQLKQENKPVPQGRVPAPCSPDSACLNSGPARGLPSSPAFPRVSVDTGREQATEKVNYFTPLPSSLL